MAGVNYWAEARQRKAKAEADYFASQRGRVRCLHCGQVVHRGSFGIGHDLFKEHRRECVGRVAA